MYQYTGQATARYPDRMSAVDDSVRATLQASRALLGVIARSVADALEEVSLPQFRVLVLLAHDGPTRSGVVADHLDIHPSTFSRNADRLVAAGWVVRTEDPDRRGAVRIELTARGLQLVEDVTESRRRAIAEILGAMTSAEREALTAALDDFSRAAGEPAARDLRTLGI